MLPPEKKARLMETKNEQRLEHLTEEEKKISAQIRSVAATLYERVDLNKPTVEFLREHFCKVPTLALAYFYCCSTDPCVEILNEKITTRICWISHVELHFKLDWESHWARRSNALSRDIQQP